MNRANLWEASADERERLADERERVSDERESLANERERLADENDRALDRRSHNSAIDDVAEATELAEVQAALNRAEAGVQRAEDELLRVRQTAARVHERGTLRAAASDRAVAARHAELALDAEESAWLADRRDFVAAERETLASERDALADDRDVTSGLRERRADDRERESLDRELRIDMRRPTNQPAPAMLARTSQEDPSHAGLRVRREHQRETATATRRRAAQDRSRAAAGWGPQPYGPMLVASFAELARQLFASDDLSDVLPQVLKFTVGAVAGCDYASITLWQNARVGDTLASIVIATELDDIQFGTAIGPALEALHGEHPVYARQLSEPSRWPVLAATAGQLGVASALCFGLSVHRSAQWSALGTLTLYGTTAHAFSDEDQEFGSILAAYLSVTVAAAQKRYEVDRREAALHRSLSTRDLIGQAKGILMERQHLSAGDAFDLLRRASQRLNRKLAAIAQHLAETGELPT